MNSLIVAMRFMREHSRLIRILASVFMLVWLLFLKSPYLNAQPVKTTPDYLHTYGNKILDSSYAVVGLSGVNWFGFETVDHAPHGLWARNWQDMLDQMKSLGYNVIRLPFSDAMLQPGVTPKYIDYSKNPDLVGLDSMQLMDKIVEGAGQRGIRIILDNHRSTAGNGPQPNGLWYTSDYPESRWIEDWKMLVERYKNNPAVIGVDLRNEPHGQACWGCGDPALDWRLAAEKAGNAIQAINPYLLIIVEGVGNYDGQSTWGGSNLMGVKDYPVLLDVPYQLVYSIHDYPESVFAFPWFNAPNYPNNLPSVWNQYWGYLVIYEMAPVLVGEFGTLDQTTKDRQWFQTFTSYIQQNRLSWTFWSWNPDSGDTGGILNNDWTTVNQARQDVLEKIQYPMLAPVPQTPLSMLTSTPGIPVTPIPSSTPVPTATLPPTPTQTVEATATASTSPTSTIELTATASQSPTPTIEPTATASPPPTPTTGATATSSPPPTLTVGAAATPSPTPTQVSTPTNKPASNTI